MTNLEDVKKGLACCAIHHDCYECYLRDRSVNCIDKIMTHAALILKDKCSDSKLIDTLINCSVNDDRDKCEKCEYHGSDCVSKLQFAALEEIQKLEGKDISKEESMKETVEKLQKAGEALSLGYKEGISDEELKAELKRGLDPKPIPEDVTGYVKPPVRTGDYIPDPAPRILDSGHRRQFESGAVRDICEGKGRCDLLPLDVVSEYLDTGVDNLRTKASLIFLNINNFVQTGDERHLDIVLDWASKGAIFEDKYTMLLEVAKQFEDGAKKYGDNNWQKGIPVRCYIDSAVRHYLKYLRGDKDEPHDRAFCWNILCCIWTCIHKPELNDYAPKEEKDA